MVPGAGIEPARLAAGDFESPASTNFTTRGMRRVGCEPRDRARIRGTKPLPAKSGIMAENGSPDKHCAPTRGYRRQEAPLFAQIREFTVLDDAHHAGALVQADVVLRAGGHHAVRYQEFVGFFPVRRATPRGTLSYRAERFSARGLTALFNKG